MKLQQDITQHIHGVLQLDGVDISPQDNLIEHGLHSLAVMQLVDIFEKKYQKTLSYTDFAMSPTVADWASIIDGVDVSSSDEAPAVALSYALPSASVALSEMQYAYWAGRQADNTAAHLYMEFAGQHLDLEKLKTAYQKLLHRHPMLNVSIANGRQSIQAFADPHIQIHDLSHLDQASVAQA
ncbi:MAG: phosphopantetheine-binding protein, partial [Acinetobacter sp.]